MKSQGNVSRETPGHTTGRFLGRGQAQESRCKAGGAAPALLPGHLFKVQQAQHLPGEDLHLGCCAPTSAPLLERGSWPRREGVSPSIISTSISPHTIVCQLKIIPILKSLNKMFWMFPSPLPRALFVWMWLIALKKNGVYSRFHCSLHTAWVLHFYGPV